MQNRLVSVVRSTPRPRDRYEGLVGRIDMSITSMSYLSISSSQLRFRIDEPEVAHIVKRMVGKPTKYVISEVEKLIEADYIPFTQIGGKPAIPGSSVKGNVRARIELSLKPTNGSIRSCFIKTTHNVKEPLVGSQGWRHWKIWRGSVEIERGVPCDYTSQQNVCLICDIFGTSGLAGLVEFSEFMADNVQLENLNLEHGVKITAAKPGSRFNGFITFRNLRTEELGLLLIGMRVLKTREGHPVLMGRLKYRKSGGLYKLGRVNFTIDAITLSKYSTELTVGGITLMRPGERLAEKQLDRIIPTLIDYTSSKFRDELNLVDEVAIVESL